MNKKRWAVLALFAAVVWLSPAQNTFAQRPQPSADIREERSFFNFLIGEWAIEKAETEGTEIGGSDTCKFRRALLDAERQLNLAAQDREFQGWREELEPRCPRNPEAQTVDVATRGRVPLTVWGKSGRSLRGLGNWTVI